ncbi:MAG: cation transporter [Burkholderiaceae bacterium]
MKTSVIEVHDMLSVLSVDEVEKRIGEVPGVESVTVNFAAANATVRYDETQLEIGDVKSTVRQRGYEPAEPVTHAPSESKATPAVPTAAPASAEDASQGKPAQSATPESPPAEPPAAPAPTSDASKPPDAPAAPEEKPDKTAPDKS